MDSAADQKLQEEAGRVAGKALRYGASLIKPGASMRDVLDAAEEYIRKQGCEPAFPAQSSVNGVAAHFCPTESEDVIYKEGDVVKLDVGAHKDGFIGDTATTIALGGNGQALVESVKAALAAVEKILRPGVTPHELGQAIQDAIIERGFQPIRNLTGHGLARWTVHTSPSIPNYPAGDHQPLTEGMVIAIEPFATDGKAGLIYSGSNPTVFSLGRVAPVRSPHARETLALIKSYNGLPFTTRWLTRELGGKAILGLNELRRAGIIHEYPPLPEKSGGRVAQHEHSYRITKDGFKRLTGVENEK